MCKHPCNSASQDQRGLMLRYILLPNEKRGYSYFVICKSSFICIQIQVIYLLKRCFGLTHSISKILLLKTNLTFCKLNNKARQWIKILNSQALILIALLQQGRNLRQYLLTQRPGFCLAGPAYFIPLWQGQNCNITWSIIIITCRNIWKIAFLLAYFVKERIFFIYMHFLCNREFRIRCKRRSQINICSYLEHYFFWMGEVI